MKSGNSQIDDNLIIKYLLGEASEDEQQNVQARLKESDEYKNYFNDFKLIWTQSRSLAVHSNLSEDDAWTKFKQRTEHAKNTSPLHNNAYKWLKVAAVFLLLVGGCLAWFITESNHKTQLLTQIKPPPITIKANDIKVTMPDSSLMAKKSKRKTMAHSMPFKKLRCSSNIIRQKKEDKISVVFNKDCTDNYKYHGPKYDSNF